MTKHKLTLEERFNLHVKVEDTNNQDSCWLWVGTKNDQGYGHFAINGKSVKSHRAAYEIFVGSIPQGHLVLHRCDNPSCVRPGHLFTGTAKDNTQDMLKKGRGKWAKGEDHYKAVFTDEEKHLIAQLVAKGWFTQLEIATRLGVVPSTIHKISRKISGKQ